LINEELEIKGIKNQIQGDSFGLFELSKDCMARPPAATKKEGGLSMWHNSGLKSGYDQVVRDHLSSYHDRPWMHFEVYIKILCLGH